MLDLTHIGDRIRESRKRKMMTIKVLAEYTGLSAGYLSMLEQNKTSPNVDSLARICEALDINIRYVLEGEEPGRTIIRHSEMNQTEYPEENMLVEIANFRQGEAIFEYITIEPGDVQKKEEYRHVCAEMCMVISGIMDLEVEGTHYKLEPGDSAYIKNGERHRIYNTGNVPCVSVWVYHRNTVELFRFKGEK